jgi:hypothetical protein
MIDYSLAVVTACTPDFLTDFNLFSASLRRFSSVKLILILLDFDNTPKLPNNISAVHMSKEEQKTATDMFGDRWVQWYKPHLIQMAIDHFGINVVLWLDCDIIIVDDPHEMFDKAVEDFFVVGDYFAPASCLNDNSLYEEFTPHREFSAEENELALNSGVVGMMLPRDQFILDMWKNKVEVVSERPNLADKVKLYDQGALLWAMRDLDILDKIVQEPRFNHNPKRNAYDVDKQFEWPYGPTHMGGDIIDQVAYDNRGVVVAHFAGLPKLSDLIKIDSQPAKQFRYNKHGKDEPAHIFGVGLERAGTHTLAEMLRGSCKYSSWIRHEYNPGISRAALAKWRGEPSDGSIEERCGVYNRIDVQFISEINHRLGFFIPEIKNMVRNSKFILQLRNPFELVKSRLRNFSYLDSRISKFPICYQFDSYSLHREFHNGSYEQNIFRIHPDHEMSVIEMHVWEISTTLRFILKDLKELCDSEYTIIWLEDISRSINNVRSLVPKHYFDWIKMREISETKYGMSRKPTGRTAEWINMEVESHAEFISDSFFNVLKEFNIDVYGREFI